MLAGDLRTLLASLHVCKPDRHLHRVNHETPTTMLSPSYATNRDSLPRINCVFEDLALQFPIRVTLLQLLFSFIRDPSRPLFLVPSLFVISCVHSPMVKPREFASPGSRRFLIGRETLWYDGSPSVETSSFNDR